MATAFVSNIKWDTQDHTLPASALLKVDGDADPTTLPAVVKAALEAKHKHTVISLDVVTN